MPLLGGAWRKNCPNASKPPAEAPMPTMGKAASVFSDAIGGYADRGQSGDGLLAFRKTSSQNQPNVWLILHLPALNAVGLMGGTGNNGHVLLPLDERDRSQWFPSILLVNVEFCYRLQRIKKTVAWRISI
jgi:hypothetical protein